MPEMVIKFKQFDVMGKLKDLKPSPYQRNKHPKEQIERLAKIMAADGIRQPIHISKKTKTICFGHGRKEAAILNGWDKYPVVYQDFKNEDEEYRCVQSDNGLSQWSELDLSAINKDLSNGDFGPFDFDLLGIKDFQLDPSDKFKTDPDAIPEVKKNDKRVKFGDLFILGNHRLLCGDSTDSKQIEKLMNDKKADMVFTDPPYGVSYEQGKFTGISVKNKFAPIANDEKRGSELRNFIRNIFTNISDTSKDSCVFYSWSPPLLPGAEILAGIIEAGWHVQSQLIWDKKRLILGRADYQWRHEVCWYGYKGKNHFWCGDRDQTSIWEQKRDSNYEHPTQKPVELAERAILNSSKNKEVIVDLFGGSGSTLIACEKTNRKCFMSEIDPIYCSVILDRWSKFTGKDPIREDGKLWSKIKT